MVKKQCHNDFHVTFMKILGQTHILHAKSIPTHILGYYLVHYSQFISGFFVLTRSPVILYPIQLIWVPIYIPLRIAIKKLE